VEESGGTSSLLSGCRHPAARDFSPRAAGWLRWRSAGWY